MFKIQNSTVKRPNLNKTLITRNFYFCGESNLEKTFMSITSVREHGVLQIPLHLGRNCRIYDMSNTNSYYNGYEFLNTAHIYHT